MRSRWGSIHWKPGPSTSSRVGSGGASADWAIPGWEAATRPRTSARTEGSLVILGWTPPVLREFQGWAGGPGCVEALGRRLGGFERQDRHAWTMYIHYRLWMSSMSCAARHSSGMPRKRRRTSASIGSPSRRLAKFSSIPSYEHG